MLLLIVLVSAAQLSVVSSRKLYCGPLEPLCQLKNVTPSGVQQKSMFLGTVEMRWSWKLFSPDVDAVAIIVNGPYPHYFKRHIFQVRDKDGKPMGKFDNDLDVCLVDCPPGRKNTAYYVKNKQTDLLAVWYPPKGFKPTNDSASLYLSAYLDDVKFWTESYFIPKRDSFAQAIDLARRDKSRRRR